MSLKYVPPSIDKTAFNCPHCGALAKQFWFDSYIKEIRKDSTPTRIDEDSKHKIIESIRAADPEEDTSNIEQWVHQSAKGHPFLEIESRSLGVQSLYNLSISRCFNCNDISIWIHNKMVYPCLGEAPMPNADLPDDIRADYNEASTILDLSPRGAAALLRLSIQKLCKHLGEKGKIIDDDIKSLVRKGLHPQVQQALDIVRVIGNGAVHPGQIDIKDDRATAEKLFGLVNLICEIMISQPKHVDEMFKSLPESARKAIEKRDKK